MYTEIRPGVFYCRATGELERCIACGRPREYVKRGWEHVANHHCPEDFENRSAGVQRRESEAYEHGLSEAVRLNFGLELLSMNGDS